MPALMIALGIVTVFFSLVSLLALSEVITNTLPKMIMTTRLERNIERIARNLNVEFERVK